MSLIINLKESRKNVEQALAFINKDKPLAKQIRFQHINTLHKIIYIQSCRLSHYANIGVLNGGTLTVENIAYNKPKAYLAKACQVTSRTIQNHIQRLAESELVKRINQDGKLLLLVNPMLLSISENFSHIQRILWDSFKNSKLLENSELVFCREKTFPINNSSGNINSIITKCVNSKKKESHGDEVIQETYRETQKTKQRIEPKQEKSQEKPPTTSVSSNRKQGEASEFQRKQFIQKQAFRLWLWCMEHLYVHHSFMAESQSEYAVAYFVETLEKKSGAELFTEISNLYIRLGKWKRFTSRKSTVPRFTPLPSTFFNQANPHGFEKTVHWLYDEKKRKKYNQAWRTARAIERETAHILAGYVKEYTRNPINQRKETIYRPLTSSEKIQALDKLAYRIERLSAKHPNIRKWYHEQLQLILTKVETKHIA